jgi:hypothetical protein
MGKYWLLFVLILSGTLQCRPLPANAQTTIALNPRQNIAAIVNSAPAGTTFLFSPGTYRMQSIVPKDNDIFHGNGAAILNGAQLLAMEPDDGRWSVLAPQGPIAQPTPSHCGEHYPLCWIFNDLFIDDQVQAPVQSLAALGAGQSFYDEASKKLYIATNPAGHKVELGTTMFAFSGMATGVYIDHLIVEKYASPILGGAVGGANARAHSWTVLKVEARWNHAIGISLGAGSLIEACNAHHNGQMGITAHGENIAILNNEIAFNNYAGYNKDWGAGGTKFSGTSNLVVRSNYVHDNLGQGLWTDIDNIHTLYEKNTVVNNTGEGIRHEISYDAIIRHNLLRGNKAGIVVVLSPNVEVYGNVVEVPADGTDGIRLANGSRGVGQFGPHVAHDDHVHNNIVTYLGPAGRSGLSGPLASATGMIFDSNEYHILGGRGKHWLWGEGPKELSDLHNIGIELHATITTKHLLSYAPVR